MNVASATPIYQPTPHFASVGSIHRPVSTSATMSRPSSRLTQESRQDRPFTHGPTNRLPEAGSDGLMALQELVDPRHGLWHHPSTFAACPRQPAHEIQSPQTSLHESNPQPTDRNGSLPWVDQSQDVPAVGFENDVNPFQLADSRPRSSPRHNEYVASNQFSQARASHLNHNQHVEPLPFVQAGEHHHGLPISDSGVSTEASHICCSAQSFDRSQGVASNSATRQGQWAGSRTVEVVRPLSRPGTFGGLSTSSSGKTAPFLSNLK
jgi:hypothetical protein